MKWVSIFVFVLLAGFAEAQSVYSITVKDEDGKEFDIKKYQGKKLLIILTKAQDPDLAKINQLSAVFKSIEKNVEFILVACSDFDSRTDNYFTKEKTDSLKLDFQVVYMGKTKKGSAEQADLFRFLTDKNQNGKFDIDVEVAWQMFAVTESGKLYAVMMGTDDIESGRLLEILNAKTN